MSHQTLTITGTGKESLSPDRITVNLTLSAKNADYSALMSLEAEKLAELTEALVDTGFDKNDIKTSSFKIQTEYENYEIENNTRKRRFSGYSVNHGLSFAFDYDMELLSQVISAISSCKKASPVFNIGFEVNDKKAALDRLLKAAVMDAKRKACAIAEAADLNLKKMESIVSEGYEPNFTSNTLMCRAAGETEMFRGTAAIDITPVDIIAETSVTVVWNAESKDK